MQLTQTKPYGLLLFVFLTFGLAFNACRYEDSMSNNSDWIKPLSNQVLEAKAWFDKTIDFEAQKPKIKPLWQLAKVEGNTVEVPIEIDGQLQIPSLKQDKVVFGKQRLYYVKSDEKQGGAIVNFLPFTTFSGKLRDVSILNYQKQGFSGLVMVRNLNYQFLRGFHIENGKFVTKVKQKESKIGDLNVRTECHWEEELYACGSICIGGVCGEPQCSSRDKAVCISGDPDPDPNPNPDPCADGSCNNGCPFNICEEGGDGNPTDNPPVVNVTNLCPSTMSGAFESHGFPVAPWTDGSGGRFPSQNIHAIYTSFKDLQVVGINGLNIPLFEITVYTLATKNFTPAELNIIGNKLAESYDGVRLTNVANGTTPNSHNFTGQWSQAFNSANNGTYSIDIIIEQSVTDAKRNNATSVQDRNSGQCRQ
jgi:hypothetical protein